MSDLNNAARTTRKPVSLALQGGGSWGAYTWGVLDGLLARRTIAIEQLSGTSAGAINAAIVASALSSGNATLARERLRAFWEGVAQPMIADFGRELWGPVERKWRETIGSWLPPALTPQGLPAGANPLRDLIAANVDLDALRGANATRLFVTVTNVRTGLPRVISNDAMSIDVLLASACLPQLFQAVEIDGEPYWDGGYSGNPTLWPMLGGAGGRDLIVVQLTPAEATAMPQGHAAIERRVNEIVFHASLVAEMQSIANTRASGGSAAPVRDLRLHRVGPPSAALSAEGSPLERSHAWITRLHAEGRQAVRRFLERHQADIGVRETLDIAKAYGRGGAAAPANDAAYAQAAGM